MKTLEDMRQFLITMADQLQSARELDKLEVYRMLIQKGESLSELEKKARTQDNKVAGCASEVYISLKLVEGYVFFQGYSQIKVIRGYLAIFIEALNGLLPKQVAYECEDIMIQFAQAVDIKGSLTPTRANTFASMFMFMRRKAEELL